MQICQNKINSFEDCSWAVSLRDVSRFCKLYIYFFNNNITKDNDVTTKLKASERTRFTSREIATALAINFCYVIRLSNKEQRKNLTILLSQEGARRGMESLKEEHF